MDIFWVTNADGKTGLAIVLEDQHERDEFLQHTGNLGMGLVISKIRLAIEAATRQHSGQLTLFDGVAPSAEPLAAEDAEPVTVSRDYRLGEEAGYRADSLVGVNSDDFVRGYEQGLLQRASYEDRYKKRG